jgi:hypothetical protein
MLAILSISMNMFFFRNKQDSNLSRIPMRDCDTYFLSD